MPSLPKYTEARRIWNKLSGEYLSVKESGQLMVELARLGDEAQNVIDSVDTRRAAIQAEIATLEEACQRWKTSETTEQERFETAARKTQEQTAVLASLDKLVAERQLKLEELQASMESLKKLVHSV